MVTNTKISVYFVTMRFKKKLYVMYLAMQNQFSRVSGCNDLNFYGSYASNGHSISIILMVVTKSYTCMYTYVDSSLDLYGIMYLRFSKSGRL